MEIVIWVVIVIAVIFWLGGLDNNRPVKNWSDDKLIRMHPKLLAARQYEKSQEVKEEIERRAELARANALLDTIQPLDIAMMQAMAKNTTILTVKTMEEHSCSEDQARTIIGERMDALKMKYTMQGCDEDTATHNALKELGLID